MDHKDKNCTCLNCKMYRVMQGEVMESADVRSLFEEMVNLAYKAHRKAPPGDILADFQAPEEILNFVAGFTFAMDVFGVPTYCTREPGMAQAMIHGMFGGIIKTAIKNKVVKMVGDGKFAMMEL